MTCDLQAIRKMEATSSLTREGRDAIRALLAEVDRLRAAIEQHREQVTSWNIVNREPAPADERLWSAGRRPVI